MTQPFICVTPTDSPVLTLPSPETGYITRSTIRAAHFHGETEPAVLRQAADYLELHALEVGVVGLELRYDTEERVDAMVVLTVLLED